MSIKLSAPIEQEFTLDKSDKEFENKGSPTTVSIRQATQGEYERREKLYRTFDRSFNEEGYTVTQKFDANDLFRLEVELTLSACNIVDENDKPIFKFKNAKISPYDFLNGWNQLHPTIAREIHEKVIEVNPLWGAPLA